MIRQRAKSPKFYHTMPIERERKRDTESTAQTKGWPYYAMTKPSLRPRGVEHQSCG